MAALEFNGKTFYRLLTEFECYRLIRYDTNDLGSNKAKKKTIEGINFIYLYIFTKNSNICRLVLIFDDNFTDKVKVLQRRYEIFIGPSKILQL